MHCLRSCSRDLDWTDIIMPRANFPLPMTLHTLGSALLPSVCRPAELADCRFFPQDPLNDLLAKANNSMQHEFRDEAISLKNCRLAHKCVRGTNPL